MAKTIEQLIAIVDEAWAKASKNKSNLDSRVLNIPGMSGHKTRHFLNNVVPGVGGRYLEVGVWQGSTFCAALNNQSSITHGFAVDNWSEFGGPSQQFVNHVQSFIDLNQTKVRLLDKDFREVTSQDLMIDKLGQFDIYLFDGPHKRIDQKEGITLYLPYLKDTFVLLVDDWNWTKDVEAGTRDAFKEANITVHKEWVATTPNNIDNNHEGWWNGYYAAVCSKPKGE